MLWLSSLLVAAALSLLGCSETMGTGGTGGNGGAEPVERAWGVPEEINGEGSVQQPGELGVSAGGSAIATWLDHDLGLWTQRYMPDEGWGTAQQLESGDGLPNPEPPLPQVAIASDGTAILVWLEQQPDAIWARRYTPEGGWEPLTRVDRGFEAYSVSGPDVAMDESGRAIATWRRSSEDGSIYASLFTVESGWSEPERIDQVSPGWDYQTRVAMNPAGNAIAVWNGDDGNGRHVFANQYTPETGWGTSAPIDDGSDTFVTSPLRVAIDGGGNGVVVWHRETAGELSSSRIIANRYTPEGGWEGAAPIEGNDQSYSYLPDVAMSIAGTTTVVWMRPGVDGGVFGTQHIADTGWASETRIFEYPFTGTDTQPRVAARAAGGALAVWRAFDFGDTVWSSHFTPNQGWDAAVKLNAPSGSCSEAQVGMDAEGDGIAFWSQSPASGSSCYANHYTVEHASAP